MQERWTKYARLVQERNKAREIDEEERTEERDDIDNAVSRCSLNAYGSLFLSLVLFPGRSENRGIYIYFSERLQLRDPGMKFSSSFTR
jgi:hypothetical protein